MLVDDEVKEFVDEITKLRKEKMDLKTQLELSQKEIIRIESSLLQDNEVSKAILQHKSSEIQQLKEQMIKEKELKQSLIEQYSEQVEVLQRTVIGKRMENYLDLKRQKAAQLKQTSALMINNLSNLNSFKSNTSQIELFKNEDELESGFRGRVRSLNLKPNKGVRPKDRSAQETKGANDVFRSAQKVRDLFADEIPEEDEGELKEGIQGKEVGISTKQNDKFSIYHNQNANNRSLSPAEIPEPEEEPTKSEKSDLSDHQKPHSTSRSELKYSKHRLNVKEKADKKSNDSLSQFFKMVEILQSQLSHEEAKGNQLIVEVQKNKELIEVLRNEAISLHRLVSQNENEKLELLSHCQHYMNQVESLEKALSHVTKEKLRFESEFNGINVLNQSQTEEALTMKLKAAEYHSSLTDVQIKCNRLESDLRMKEGDLYSCSMQLKAKDEEFETTVNQLKQEVIRLANENNELSSAFSSYRKKADFELFNQQKNNEVSKFEMEIKLKDFEKEMRDLIDQFESQCPGFMSKRKKDDLDNSFQALKPLNFDDHSLFSFNQGTNKKHSVEFVYNRHLDSSNNSQLEHREPINRGSFVLDECCESEDHLLKPKHRMSVDARKLEQETYMGRNFTLAADFALPEEYLSIKQLSGEIQIHENANNAIQTPCLDVCLKSEVVNNKGEMENDDKCVNLIKEIEEKELKITHMQMQIETLKADLNALRNEAEMKDLLIENSRKEFELKQLNNQKLISMLQRDFESITTQFISAKTAHNELEAQKDIDSMVFTRKMKAKNQELDIYKRQHSEMTQFIQKKANFK
jgi:hypothetical protein